MKRWRVSGRGRTVGAIGLSHDFSQVVEAESEEAAKLAIYQFYEHISGMVVQEVK